MSSSFPGSFPHQRYCGQIGPVTASLLPGRVAVLWDQGASVGSNVTFCEGPCDVHRGAPWSAPILGCHSALGLGHPHLHQLFGFPEGGRRNHGSYGRTGIERRRSAGRRFRCLRIANGGSGQQCQ